MFGGKCVVDEASIWEVGSVVSGLSVVVSLALGAGSWSGVSSFRVKEISTG